MLDCCSVPLRHDPLWLVQGPSFRYNRVSQSFALRSLHLYVLKGRRMSEGSTEIYLYFYKTAPPLIGLDSHHASCCCALHTCVCHNTLIVCFGWCTYKKVMPESLDIVRRLDEDPAFGSPVLAPAAGRTDIDDWISSIAMMQRRLLRPRHAVAPLPEFQVLC